MTAQPQYLVRMAALAGCIAVAACGSTFQDPIVLGCPDYRILEDAASLTKFRDGPGRDITDIQFRAEMGEISLSCLSDIDNETNSGLMEVDIAPLMQMELGPAGEDFSPTVAYFIVVTDADKEILYRSEESIDVSFQNNRSRVVVSAPTVTLELPITPSIRNTNYLIYSGFVLTEAQAQFNRRNIQRRLNP